VVSRIPPETSGGSRRVEWLSEAYPWKANLMDQRNPWANASFCAVGADLGGARDGEAGV
jgi:hypothetical protein